MKVIRQELEQQQTIHLEVQGDNIRALQLYKNVGFVAYDSQDYYDL